MKTSFSANRFKSTEIPQSLSGSPGSWTVLGMSLRERQERAVLLANGKMTDADKAQLWIRDDAMVTAEAIAAFVSHAESVSGPVSWRANGRTGAFVDEIKLADDSPVLIWLPVEGPLTDDVISRAKELRVDVKEQLFQLPVPRSQFGVDVIELPLSDFIVVPTRHWLQLLWANLLGLGPFLWRELVGRNPVTALLKLAWAVVRSRSIRPDKIGAKLNKRGKKCNIHPTAVVEGSWLGNGVEIGANAVVRGCVLGDGAVVEDLALVEFSVMGQGAKVQRQAMVKFSLLSPFSAVAGVMQLGVMDTNSALKRGAFLMDMNLSGKGAHVVYGDKKSLAPMGLAGCCLGANAIIGLGVSVAAGRKIPNDVTVVADTSAVVLKVPENIDGLCVVKEGTLCRL